MGAAGAEVDCEQVHALRQVVRLGGGNQVAWGPSALLHHVPAHPPSGHRPPVTSYLASKYHLRRVAELGCPGAWGART